MATTEDVVRRLVLTRGYLDGMHCGHCENVREAIEKIKELTPKHDPAIDEEVKLLRKTVNRFLEPTDREVMSRAADRLEAMNPPAPPKPYEELRTDAYDWLFRTQADTPENRAKLEAAIKILGEK